ncbi:hypothetical protein YYE_00275 [Plasmodium vinckei vinckei]|nr:hypothetical protein YYE_00275 [Plasmodium vinckei vinckei]
MDPDGPKKIYNTFIEGTFSRLYNENLLIVRQQYQSVEGGWRRHCYVIINKVELSKDETAIIMVSTHEDYHNWKMKMKHLNPIIKSANSFNPDIPHYEDMFKNELSKKMYVNLAAFFIKKGEDNVKITYVSSNFYNIYLHPTQIELYCFINNIKINFNIVNADKFILEFITNNNQILFQKLKNKIDELHIKYKDHFDLRNITNNNQILFQKLKNKIDELHIKYKDHFDLRNIFDDENTMKRQRDFR